MRTARSCKTPGNPRCRFPTAVSRGAPVGRGLAPVERGAVGRREPPRGFGGAGPRWPLGPARPPRDAGLGGRRRHGGGGCSATRAGQASPVRRPAAHSGQCTPGRRTTGANARGSHEGRTAPFDGRGRTAAARVGRDPGTLARRREADADGPGGRGPRGELGRRLGPALQPLLFHPDRSRVDRPGPSCPDPRRAGAGGEDPVSGGAPEHRQRHRQRRHAAARLRTAPADAGRRTAARRGQAPVACGSRLPAGGGPYAPLRRAARRYARVRAAGAGRGADDARGAGDVLRRRRADRVAGQPPRSPSATASPDCCSTYCSARSSSSG